MFKVCKKKYSSLKHHNRLWSNIWHLNFGTRLGWRGNFLEDLDRILKFCLERKCSIFLDRIPKFCLERKCSNFLLLRPILNTKIIFWIVFFFEYFKRKQIIPKWSSSLFQNIEKRMNTNSQTENFSNSKSSNETNWN